MSPEVRARISNYMKGYEDAPGMYKLERLFVCESAHRNEWDDAAAEKILSNRAKKLFDDGDISLKEYEKIKDVVKRETDKILYKLTCFGNWPNFILNRLCTVNHFLFTTVFF